MKRGSGFFEEFSSSVVPIEKGRTGRSVVMLNKRNEKLFHRYYYHSRILQLKYELVLSALVNEFDLTESTLTQIIEKNTKRIKEIGEKKMTRQKLKNLYPSFNWSDKVNVPEPVKSLEVYNRY